MSLPALFIAAIGALAVSLPLLLAGYASSFWIQVAESESLRAFHFGLWAICFPDPQGCQSLELYFGYTPGGHVYLGRVTGIAALTSTAVSLFFLLLFAFKESRLSWAKTAQYGAIASGIVCLLGAVVFVIREKLDDDYGNDTVGWSAIVSFVAGILQIIAGVCVLLPIRSGQLQYEQLD